MEHLATILPSTMQNYTGQGANVYAFLMQDQVNQVYSVSMIDYPVRRYVPAMILLARIVGDKIVIETDHTDKPLVEALVAAGIPREQIVLAYAGETLTEDIIYQ